MSAVLHRPSNSQVRSAVQSAINTSPDVDALVVSVDCLDGTVTLRGEVSSYSERVAAAELASGSPGVVAVDNRLTVRPFGQDWAIADDSIAEAIDRALTAEFPASVRDGVRASVYCHVVTLTGSIPSAAERTAVRHAVSRVRGVDLVKNQLSVGRRVRD